MNGKVLVAGIGNIFLGDDAFGVEVTKRLVERVLPYGVSVVDFGIRSYDLAYALMEKWDLIILVDALPRGGEPGHCTLWSRVAAPGRRPCFLGRAQHESRRGFAVSERFGRTSRTVARGGLRTRHCRARSGRGFRFECAGQRSSR